MINRLLCVVRIFMNQTLFQNKFKTKATSPDKKLIKLTFVKGKKLSYQQLQMLCSPKGLFSRRKGSTTKFLESPGNNSNWPTLIFTGKLWIVFMQPFFSHNHCTLLRLKFFRPVTIYWLINPFFTILFQYKFITKTLYNLFTTGQKSNKIHLCGLNKITFFQQF